MLNEFTKEERIIFGLNIIELEKKKKPNMTKSEEKRHLAKLERIREQRQEFLKSLD